MTTPNRALQWCHGCRQPDDHPRHHHFGSDGQLVSKHIDCCAADGCPDESCHQILRESGNAHGQDLIAHLERRAMAEQQEADNG